MSLNLRNGSGLETNQGVMNFKRSILVILWDFFIIQIK